MPLMLREGHTILPGALTSEYNEGAEIYLNNIPYPAAGQGIAVPTVNL